MDNFKSVIEGIVETAERNQPRDESDYINPDDGLLYCGRCHTRKQFRLELPGIEPRVLPVPCECRKRELDEERARELAKQRSEELLELRNLSMMDAACQLHTLERFKTNPNNENVARLCQRYVDKFEDMTANNQGLLFYGDVGTGKTFAAACIANALLDKGVSVVMTSFVKVLENILKNKDAEEGLVNRLMRAELLVLDDLGAERGTDFALEKVYDIIDSRYRLHRPMILTTNLTLDEMKGTRDIRYSRIYDRIFEVCYPVKFTGVSYRKAEANKRYTQMKKLLEE